MRNISSNGLAKLANRYGNEPICIVEIDWTPHATIAYADRDLPGTGIAGKIIELSQLDDVVDIVLTNGSSASIEITLDDTSGEIKALYNSYDFHKRSVRVYQWFQGLDLSDKFLIFSGKLNTPLTWNERDRTVKLAVLSHLEDQEVGFSPEAGQFAWLPSAMCGKAWPMIFGTVQDCPATQITRICQAVTITPVGIPSGSDHYLAAPLYANGTNTDIGGRASLFQLQVQMDICEMAANCWQADPNGGPGSTAWDKAAALMNQWQKLGQQRAQLLAKMAKKEQCITLSRRAAVDYVRTHGLGDNPIQTLGGEDFPQNTPIWVNIGGGSFYGHFEGNLFFVAERVNLDDAVQLATDLYTFQEGQCNATQTGGPRTTPFSYVQTVPVGSTCDGSNTLMTQAMPSGATGIDDNLKDLVPGQMRIYGYTFNGANRAGVTFPGIGFGQAPDSSSWLRIFWREGGQTVTMETAEPVSYVVSIVPGSVLCVKAFKQYDGPHLLTTVPSDFYTVSTVNYGSITAVVLTLKRQLSTYRYPTGENQGWSNELYVTFESSVGPNTVDVMKYLIDTYTDLAWDATSFNHVHSRLQPFPSNFALLETKNVIEVLREIAFQARCAIWISEDVFHLRYLPEEPDPVTTITVSDIDSERGVEVGYTPTESICTKMKVAWKLSLAPDNPYPSDAEKHAQTMVLRHNMAAYGLHEKSFSWYIYTQPDIIFKCATFWMIRFSTTWKTLKFRTFLNKLNVETLDTILFDDGGRGYVSNGPVKAFVKKAAYNSAEDAIDFECEVPVKAGEMVYYPFYWPSNLPQTMTWPPADEIASGAAGGGGIGVWASGTLPSGALGGQLSGRTVFVGGPNIIFGPHSDRGDRTPTDVGFVAQPSFPSDSITSIPTNVRPYLNTGIAFLTEEEPIVFDAPDQTAVIDLYKTVIIDSSTIKASPTQVGYLGDFFNINPEGGLRLELAAAQVVDGRGKVKATTGKDAPLSDIFTVGKIKGDNAVLLDASGDGIYAVTNDVADGAVVDLKYDSDGKKVGIATAFLQNP